MRGSHTLHLSSRNFATSEISGTQGPEARAKLAALGTGSRTSCSAGMTTRTNVIPAPLAAQRERGLGRDPVHVSAQVRRHRSATLRLFGRQKAGFGILIPGAPLEQSARFLLVGAAPLLEEER